MRRALSCLVLGALCAGFAWPGRPHRLAYDLAHGDAARRRDVVRELAGLSDDATGATLLTALEDEDPDVRTEAALAAGHRRLREAAPILIEWLDDARPATRTAAIEALGLLGATGALERLVHALGDAEAEVRRTAAEAVTAIGGADAVTALIARRGDGDVGVRIVVADGLGRLADARAIEPLRTSARDTAPEVREAAVRALGRLRDARALGTLEQALADTAERVRLAATGALCRIADPHSVRALARLLGAPDRRLARAATVTLGCIGDAQAVEALTGALADETLRASATLALAAHAKPGVPSPGAVPALSDKAPFTLANWDPAEGLAHAAGRLRALSSARRAEAALSLGAFPTREARSVLRYVLRRDTPRVVGAAALALGEIGDQRDLDSLLKAAQHRRWPVAAAVSWAITRMAARGVLREHATTRRLCDFGRTRDPIVRANVAATLGAWGAAPCATGGPDPLTWLATARDASVRVASARWARFGAASGRVDAARAGGALGHCSLADVDGSVRSACAATDDRAIEHTTHDVMVAGSERGSGGALVELRFADGSVWLGPVGVNGRVRIAGAARGEIRLGVAGLAALEPAGAPAVTESHHDADVPDASESP